MLSPVRRGAAAAGPGAFIGSVPRRGSAAAAPRLAATARPGRAAPADWAREAAARPERPGTARYGPV